MPDKYNPAKCEHYGRRLAARLCDQHFAADGSVTLDGPGILGFTPVRQVNLLVVRQLLHQWQADTSKLRSPYFDFEAPAVQAALKEFQNVLSRYIKVGRSAFEPMLTNAVTGTLHLVANPVRSFEQLFLGQHVSLTIAQMRENLRYLDINKEFFTSFLDTLPAGSTLTTADISAQLTAYQSTNYRSQQPMQQLVVALSALLPLTEADLWEEGTVSTANPPVDVPAISTPRFTTDAQTEVTPQELPAADDYRQSIPVTPTIGYSETLKTTDVPLHEKLKATQPTAVPLAAALRAAQPQPSALAERNAPKVESLREAISINQRFSFINELFNGENMEYHAAIQHLDSLTDLEQAQFYITNQLAQRYDWGRKEEHVNKLLKLVERKFAALQA